MRHLYLLAFIFLPTLVWGNQSTGVSIHKAWVREAPPGVTAMAGYMNLVNNTTETVVLETLSSPDFERVELHQTRINGNTARMEKKNTLSLQPGSTAELKPGHFHLMLFNPFRSLRAGDQVTLTITFKNQESRTIQAEVRAIHEDAGSHQHHH